MTHGLEIRNSAGEVVFTTERLGMLPVLIEPLRFDTPDHYTDLPGYAGRTVAVYYSNFNYSNGAVAISYPGGIPRISVDVDNSAKGGGGGLSLDGPGFFMIYLTS